MGEETLLNALLYVGQPPDRELRALGSQWCQGEERLLRKMERLSDSEGCGLASDVRWGKSNKNSSSSSSGRTEARSIGGQASQQPPGEVRGWSVYSALGKQGCGGIITREASIARAESWRCFHPDVNGGFVIY